MSFIVMFSLQSFFMTLELKGRLIDMEKGYKHIPFLIFFFFGGGGCSYDSNNIARF